jgi:hypothetical protein
MLVADNHAYYASEAQQLFTFLSTDPDNTGLKQLQLADSGERLALCSPGCAVLHYYMQQLWFPSCLVALMFCMVSAAVHVRRQDLYNIGLKELQLADSGKHTPRTAVNTWHIFASLLFTDGRMPATFSICCRQSHTSMRNSTTGMQAVHCQRLTLAGAAWCACCNGIRTQTNNSLNWTPPAPVASRTTMYLLF